MRREKALWRLFLSIGIVHAVSSTAIYTRTVMGTFNNITSTLTSVYAIVTVAVTLYAYERYKHYR